MSQISTTTPRLHHKYSILVVTDHDSMFISFLYDPQSQSGKGHKHTPHACSQNAMQAWLLLWISSVIRLLPPVVPQLRFANPLKPKGCRLRQLAPEFALNHMTACMFTCVSLLLHGPATVNVVRFCLARFLTVHAQLNSELSLLSLLQRWRLCRREDVWRISQQVEPH